MAVLNFQLLYDLLRVVAIFVLFSLGHGLCVNTPVHVSNVLLLKLLTEIAPNNHLVTASIP